MPLPPGAGHDALTTPYDHDRDRSARRWRQPGGLSLAAKRPQASCPERAAPLPLEDQTSPIVDLFRRYRFHASEQWVGTDGDPFNPQAIYALGGNTKDLGRQCLNHAPRPSSTGRWAMQEGQAPRLGPQATPSCPLV